MTKGLKSKIYEKMSTTFRSIKFCFLLPYIDNMENYGIADEVYSYVEDVERIHIDKLQEYKKEFTAIMENMQTLFKNVVKKLENDIQQKEKQIIQDRIVIKDCHILRQYINSLFQQKWDGLPESLKNNTDFKTLAQNTTLLQRKNFINHCEGIKYAILITSDLHTGLSKDLCEFYIKLRGRCYVPLKPLTCVNSHKVSPRGALCPPNTRTRKNHHRKR